MSLVFSGALLIKERRRLKGSFFFLPNFNIFSNNVLRLLSMRFITSKKKV